MNKFLLSLILCLLPALAFANSGRIIYVQGTVTVERSGQLYRAVRNAKVIEGDTLRTGDDGRLHVRMSDQSLFSLKPGSEFTIEEYRYQDAFEPLLPTQAAVAPPAVQRDAVSFYRLLRGGLRVVSGFVGREDRDQFALRTPVATIGIRGTSFTVDLEPGDAGQRLTVSVGDGAVIITSPSGSLLLQNGEFGSVTGNRPPRRELRPSADSDASEEPTLPEGDDETGGSGSANTSGTGEELSARRHSTESQGGLGGGESGGQQTSETDGEVVTPDNEPAVLQGPRLDLAHSFGSAISESDNSRLDPDTPGTARSLLLGQTAVQLNASGQIVSFVGAVPGLDGRLLPAVIELGPEARIANAGFDPVTELRWGRWADGVAVVRFADGTTENLSLESAQIHTIHTGLRDSAPLLPSIGVLNYQLVGNTDPTSSTGASGVLGEADLMANFELQRVNSSILLGIDNQVWSASGEGRIGGSLGGGTPAQQFAGQYTTVTIDNVGSGNGVFSGFFSNNAAGAGLGYTLQAGEETVTGTAAFRQE